MIVIAVTSSFTNISSDQIKFVSHRKLKEVTRSQVPIENMIDTELIQNKICPILHKIYHTSRVYIYNSRILNARSFGI